MCKAAKMVFKPVTAEGNAKECQNRKKVLTQQVTLWIEVFTQHPISSRDT